MSVWWYRGERTLGPEELSRDVELLAADDNDLLAVEELLGDGAGETTEKVSLAINDDLLLQKPPSAHVFLLHLLTQFVPSGR